MFTVEELLDELELDDWLLVLLFTVDELELEELDDELELDD